MGTIPEEANDESDTETKLAEALQTIQEEQGKEEKRKKKKLLKEIKKIQEKTSLDMIIPGDAGPTDTMENSMFNLKGVKTMDDLERLTSNPQMPDMESTEMDDNEEMEFYEEKRKKKVVRYSKNEQVLDKSGKFYKSTDDAGDSGGGSDDSDDEEIDLKKGLGLGGNEDDDEDKMDINIDDMDDEDEAAPPLLTDLDPRDKSVKRLKKAERWFDNDIFKSIGYDEDEDVELNKLAESYIKKGAKVPGFEKDMKAEKEEKETKKEAKKKAAATAKRKAEDVAGLLGGADDATTTGPVSSTFPSFVRFCTRLKFTLSSICCFMHF